MPDDKKLLSEIHSALGVDGTWNPVHVIEQWRREIELLTAERDAAKAKLREVRSWADWLATTPPGEMPIADVVWKLRQIAAGRSA